MILVDYSDSESDDHHEKGSRKRKVEHIEDEAVTTKLPPPLPPSFRSLYATSVRTSTTDDPSLHAGRTRQAPHVIGNWPTHVYLEWYPSQSELSILDALIKDSMSVDTPAQHVAKSHVHSFLRSELGAQLPLHVSLSAPLVLQTDQKERFEDTIKQKLSEHHIKSFMVEVAKVDWVANHDKTRFFLVLRVSQPDEDEFNRLLSICNAAAKQFDLPLLYAKEHDTRPDVVPPSMRNGQRISSNESNPFHISVAWTLDEPDDRTRESLGQRVDQQLHGLKVSFSLLKLKIGNLILDLPLE